MAWKGGGLHFLKAWLCTGTIQKFLAHIRFLFLFLFLYLYLLLLLPLGGKLLCRVINHLPRSFDKLVLS